MTDSNSVAATPEIIDAAVRAWLGGVTTPHAFKTKKAIDKDIPAKDALEMLRSTGRAGFACQIRIDEQPMHVYATFYRLRLWLNLNWNTNPPTVEGDVVQESVVRIVHEIRARELEEAAALAAQAEMPDAAHEPGQ